MDGWRVLRDGFVALLTGAIVLLPLRAPAQGPPQPGDQPPQMQGAELAAPVETEQAGPIRGMVQRVWGYVDPDNAEIISMHQLACLIDHVDKSLHCRGQVVVKSPDVWGQNRLTQHRGIRRPDEGPAREF